jgi:signal transduction histidine kinase
MLQSHAQERLIELLQQLLDIPALDLVQAMNGATTAVAQWLECDKADAFLLDAGRASLVALGTSDTPLGQRQQALGLDVQPVANGGRVVTTYQTGQAFLTGHAEDDPDEVPGVLRDLGVRSTMNVALDIGGERRGVLSVVSQQPERFSESDLRALELVARWTGALAHRAELVARLREEERGRARKATAEEIVTVLAHDIRNHLTPLNGRLQLLKLKIEKQQPIEPRLLDNALRAVRRIVRLTDGLLDLSRLDEGLFELDLEPVDICTLVRGASASFATASNEVEIVAPQSLIVIGDGQRLCQALENVIANGIRHSRKGAPLRVVVEQRERQALVSVIDSGTGIPPDVMPRLFERFTSTRGSHGLGLGLYLASRIAESHGGSLRARSELGKGATFVFELPVEGP